MASEPTLADALRVLAAEQDFMRAARLLGVAPERLSEILREGAGAVGFTAPKLKGLAATLPLALTPKPPPKAPEAAPVGGGEHLHVVVFSDGAARGNPGPAGAGAVVKLPNGRIVARVGRFLGVQTNNVAEYQGLVIGLEKALELGAKKVDVRADSMLVIMQLRGEWKLKHPGLRPHFDEAKKLLARFDGVTLEHVRREQNGDADEMSNRAIDEKM